jgi:rRNA maturation RNase YbeY
MNQDHLDHDYYTDIITFNYNQDNKVSGDLFISIDRIRDNANKISITFEQELKRVMIHGVLHLIGYNDSSEEEKTEMRNQEDMCLELA